MFKFDKSNIAMRQNAAQLKKATDRIELRGHGGNLIAIGLGIWCYNLNKENEHLQKVEWLYCYERVSYDAEDIRNMMLREEAMMAGNRQEQDSIKAMTIRQEHRPYPCLFPAL